MHIAHTCDIIVVESCDVCPSLPLARGILNFLQDSFVPPDIFILSHLLSNVNNQCCNLQNLILGADMLTDSDKIKAFRTQQKLTQAALAENLGLKQQQIAMIENGTRPASSGFKLAFLKAYGIDWDSQIASGETYTYEHLEKESNIIAIPFYPVKAAAGSGVDVPEYAEKDVIHFDKRWLQAIVGHNPKNLSLIKAEGDSMFPDIQDGDLLMVDDSIKEVIPNKTFVIKQDNKYRVKKLKAEFNGDIQIISNNPNYKTETMDRETEIIGQVVWNGSKETI